MSKRTDLDQLVLLADDELKDRIQACAARIETRVERAQNGNRDLLDREAELSRQDRDELVALRDATEIRAARREEGDRIEQQTHERMEQVQQAIDAASTVETRAALWQPTLLVSQKHLAEHAAALREGRPHGTVETRARVTVAGDLGSAGAWNPGMPNEPRHLIRFAPIPVSPLTGRTAQVPKYTGPAATAGVDETTAHPEYDAVAPVNLTALRYGRWSDVSALASAVDDLTGVNQMHAWGIARDLDALAVTAVETAAASPAAMTDLEQQVREAILAVAAATYSDESALVVVGTPADVSLLTTTTPANAADVGSLPVRFHGAKLYPATAATPGRVCVFAPGSFRVFQTSLQSASLIDPSDGASKFGTWLHSTGVAEQVVGSAVAVATS